MPDISLIPGLDSVAAVIGYLSIIFGVIYKLAMWAVSRPKWAESRTLAWAKDRLVKQENAAKLDAILKEFRPNGGSSFRDSINRIEGIAAEIRAAQEKGAARAARDGARLAGFLNFTNEALWQTDAQGQVTWVNRRYCDLLGRSLDEVRGMNWKNTLHPDDAERIASTWADVVRDGRSHVLSFRALHGKTGEIVYLHSHGDPMRDEGTGAITGWFGHMTAEERVMPVPKSAIAKRRLLWVEDGLDMKQVITEHLKIRAPDFAVSITSNGRDAIEQIRDAHATGHPFESIVLDVSMPGIDGIQTLELIREQERLHMWHPVRACFCTGIKEHVSPQDLHRLSARIFEKPVEWEGVTRWINS